MTPLELLAHLSAQGIAVALDGADIEVEGGTAMLCDELVEVIRQHKPELVALLAEKHDHADQPGEAFDDWVPRIGADGNFGFEPPNLPTADRWWARRRFEDLDDLPSDVPSCRPGRGLTSAVVRLDDAGNVTISDLLRPKEN